MTNAQFKKSAGYMPTLVLLALLYLIAIYFALCIIKFHVAPIPGDETPMALGIMLSFVSPLFIGSWANCAIEKFRPVGFCVFLRPQEF